MQVSLPTWLTIDIENWHFNFCQHSEKALLPHSWRSLRSMTATADGRRDEQTDVQGIYTVSQKNKDNIYTTLVRSFAKC